ncbi:MAG: DNA repair protein RadC [Lachnospira sp.]
MELNRITEGKVDNLRPYEKCDQYGVESLTDAELLAVVIRTGVSGMSSVELADKVLKNCMDDGLLGLVNMSVGQLKKIKGIGKVKAIEIKCICELSRRIAKSSARVKLTFSDAYTVASYYMEDLRHLKQEHIILAMLDNKCRLICDRVISVGTVNSSVITAREIFEEALKNSAVFVCLLHNHPSGDATPSNQDIIFTKQIASAGEIIGIKLIDHIVIGDNCYVSMNEQEII